MSYIMRKNLNDWTDYLKEKLSENLIEYKVETSCFELENGPYSTVEHAKLEISDDLLGYYNSLVKSDLYESIEYKLAPDNNVLLVNQIQKRPKNAERLILEAGAPLETLDVEYNILEYQKTIINHPQSKLITGNKGVKPFSDLDSYNEVTKYRTSTLDGYNTNSEKHFSVMNDFLKTIKKLNVENDDYVNSYVCLKDMIPHPNNDNIVHFLNPFNLTFYFLSEEPLKYFEYFKKVFDVEFQRKANFSGWVHGSNWNVKLNRSYERTGKFTIYWEPDGLYHLAGDCYGITIHKHQTNSNSIKAMIDFIEHFDRFVFDWDNYPGNLYVGNVCKILK